MKNKIIKFVKKNPFLYNLAKKINRRLNRIPPKQEYHSKCIYYTYMMSNKEELELIKAHYNTIKTDKSKLFIVITDKEHQKDIHRLIRENLDILFADINYFKKYQKKMIMDRMLLLDYHQSKEQEILEYVNWKIS